MSPEGIEAAETDQAPIGRKSIKRRSVSRHQGREGRTRSLPLRHGQIACLLETDTLTGSNSSNTLLFDL
jgi:hypothetical protein